MVSVSAGAGPSVSGDATLSSPLILPPVPGIPVTSPLGDFATHAVQPGTGPRVAVVSFGDSGKTSSTCVVEAFASSFGTLRVADTVPSLLTSPSRSNSTCANAGPAPSATTPAITAPATNSLRIMMLLFSQCRLRVD